MLTTRSLPATDENLALLAKHFSSVESVQPTPVCRAINVTVGDRFTGYLADKTKLALLNAESKLRDWGINFYFGARSDRTFASTTSYPGDGTPVADRQHLWLC